MVTVLLAGNGNDARRQQFDWEIGKNREQKMKIAKKQKIVFIGDKTIHRFGTKIDLCSPETLNDGHL